MSDVENQALGVQACGIGSLILPVGWHGNEMSDRIKEVGQRSALNGGVCICLQVERGKSCHCRKPHAARLTFSEKKKEQRLKIPKALRAIVPVDAYHAKNAKCYQMRVVIISPI